MPFLGKSRRDIQSAGKPGLMTLDARDAALWGGDEYRPQGAGMSLNLSSPSLPGHNSERGLPAPGRRACGNPGCTHSWAMPWRSRRRPIFESRWGCSAACIRSIIAASVRRELGDAGAGIDPPQHRHRVPLGLVMLAQGWITHPQLRRALDAQRAHGTGRIGEWLVSECGLDTDCVTRGLSVQWNCPVLSLTGFSPRAMSLAMPPTLSREFGVLPIRVAGSRLLYLGFQDRLDASAAFALEQMSGLRTESGLVAEAEFQAAMESLSQGTAIACTQETVTHADALTERIATVLGSTQPIASRLVRMHRFYWLRTWLESGTIGVAGQLPVSTEDMCDHLYVIGPQA